MTVLHIEYSITAGDGGPSITLDPSEFCRVASRRDPATGILTTSVRF